MPPNSIRLINAQATHIEAIKACAQQAYQRYVERMNKTPAPMIADFEQLVVQERVVVALAADELLGFVVFYPTEHGMHLENIAVLPTTQSSGIGAKLVAHVEKQAQSLGLNNVHLYTNVAMHENFSWYERLGYSETERKSQDGFERVFFKKMLSVK